jgi:hypothetical protein
MDGSKVITVQQCLYVSPVIVFLTGFLLVYVQVVGCGCGLDRPNVHVHTAYVCTFTYIHRMKKIID